MSLPDSPTPSTKTGHLALGGLALLTAVAAPAGAQTNEDLKIYADDAQEGDSFGSSVATSGDWLLVGAPAEDDNGSIAGAAYLFDRHTGQQVAKLLDPVGTANDRFGLDVAISGDKGLISAPTDTPFGPFSGSAHVFDLNTGLLLHRLLPSDGQSGSGFAAEIDASGDRALIAADGIEAAYVFDMNTGQQLFKLIGSDSAPGDFYGSAVAISSDRALVGAQFDDDLGSNSGAAFVFDLNTGQELFKLLPADGEANDWFGDAAALSDDRALIGARQDDDNGTDAGAVYVFDMSTGQQIHKLVASDGEAGDNFGTSVAISGDMALIGAWRDTNQNGALAGAAYLFDLTTGQEVTKFLASDGLPSAGFGGFAVSLSATTALVGANRDDTRGTDAGAAYVFNLFPNDDCSGAIPIGIGETVFSNVGAGDSGVNMGCVSNGEASDVWFSYTAIGDCSVTIDLFGSSYDTAAAVYSGDCGALTQVDCNDDGGAVKTGTSFLSFTATAGTTYLIQVGGFSGASGDGVINVTEGVGSLVCAGNANSTGVGAVLRACGSSLVADNAVNLELTDLPLNQTVLFVNSRETILVANPGGSQGDLCIGSLALGRHVNDVLDSGATGAASLTLDLANVPTNLGRTAVLAGETWYWQAWYRDVDGGGTPTSNLSSAVGVTFN